jgi:hypothetical protein
MNAIPINPENEALAQRAETIADTATAAIDWLDAAGDLVRDEGPAMARDFRRETLRARKLAAAARRPMCVSVFGPSQQGKSYLIASLARKGDALTMIRFGEEVRDFVADINPDGGKESTGLVTRFTIRPVMGLPGMPVACRMLSETDIIKIMANAFMEDFDRDTVTALEPKRIEDIMAKMRAKAGRDPVDRMSEDDVYDMFEYFERYFRNHPTHVALKPAYWREMETLGPRLSIQDRTEMFGLLWNLTPTMTRVATKLVLALGQLDFPDEAFAPMAAIEPKRSSIIDVETMAPLGEDSTDKLPVATRMGRRADLERAVLTAIVAELQLQLADKPFDFFDHTDLLDFPGARTRGKESAQNAEKEAQNNIFLLFRRGKVAYLYQRYLAEQELTSMLLCLKHSNQEVATVPFMVNDWISSTHGAMPEARKGRETALFLIYTMFDVEFALKAGQQDDAVERWSTRIETTLHSYLGKSHDWVESWTPGKAFNNTYWLRNPAVRDEGLLDYDGKTEARFRNPDRMAMLRGTFLSNHDVQKHFADPGLAWDSAMALNDGGIAYIAARLGPVCNPALKRDQVDGQVGELVKRMTGRLEPYFVTGDLDAELTKRRNEARLVGRQLLACAEAQSFGLLLRDLQVRAEAMTDLFRRQQLEAASTPSVVNAPLGTRADRRALQDDFDAMFDEPAPEPVEEEAPAGPRDLADMFAETAVTEWLQGMHRFAARTDVHDLFKIDRDAAQVLVAQIAAAARRLGLREAIAERMRTGAAYHGDPADRLLKPVMIAERMINDFVTWLGFDTVPPDLRPKAGREQRIIFVRTPAAEDIPALSETPLAYDSTFYVDWAIAFVRLVEDNVRSTGGITVDIQTNARLGTLLNGLRSMAA